MNKKKLIIILIIIILILSCLGIILYQKISIENQKRKIINEIKNSYSEYVVVNNDKKLYINDKDLYKEVGTVYKSSTISLENKDVKDENDIYYKIKDTNYYIDYKDIKKTNKIEEDTSLDKYIANKKIQTTKTRLYQDDILKFDIDCEYEFDILLSDNNTYYVKYLNQIYQIKDSYVLLDKEIEEKLLTDISVLNFSDDIKLEKLDEVLKYLKENNYETITLNDFKLWIDKKVNLSDKKVLLLSYKELNKEKEEVLEKYNYIIDTSIKDNNLSFTSGDTKLKIGDSKYYKYEILNTTTLDRVKDMLNGIKEKIVVKSNKIAVLNYHFFYDSSIGEGCNESICIDMVNFRKQLDYLKNNGYKTLTMSEFNDWMDKKITLPEKSVLITIDDGALGTSKINGNKLIPILEEYKMHATLFLITGWWDINNYRSDYLEIQSHGDNLHFDNYCDNSGCGYKTLKLNKEELKKDLKLSIDKIGSNLAFCYPFYRKNNTLEEALKESGFKLGFIGGNYKVSQNTNKYNIPRYIIYKNTSLDSFINMVK